MMIIKIYNRTKFNIFDLKRILVKIFLFLEEKKKINIIFINNKMIKKMNFYYRKKDYPTDILSFENPIINNVFLGDIFISLEKVQEQFKNYNHTFEKEIVFLALHGYLHLKGYKDNTSKSLQQMIEIQEYILQKYKLLFKNKNFI
ncbi:rRNA maturation RNase YbeY [Candidatus Phytoplasma pini]|uniref:Endoribonuclease YbeY n=1 Tax=Candidatus Phytoplasma pini TaxID=267362 RepID=A0A559KJ91_9MOLU|nr:rRNA maturation RNase YbeY [Candidatus Phytoplasma pini]TVY12177.1 putative metal-dependent hydrolase [Candidatus Phytoplasma pini]